MAFRDTQQRAARATGRSRGAAHVQSVQRAASLLRAVASAAGPASTATALAEAPWASTARPPGGSCRRSSASGWSPTTRRPAGTPGLRPHRPRGPGRRRLAGGVASRAVLQRIAAETGETAALAVLRGPRPDLRRRGDPGLGRGWPAGTAAEAVMHATSTGKALLAFSDPGDVPRPAGGCRAAAGCRGFTSATITTLRRARRRARAHPGARVLGVPGRVHGVGLGRLRPRARRHRASRGDPEPVGAARAGHRGPVRRARGSIVVSGAEQISARRGRPRV